MRQRKFFWLTALVMLVIMALAGEAFAVDLRYNESDSQWSTLKEKLVPGRSGNDPANDYYGTNCYCFVDWVLQNEGRGRLSGFCYEAYLLGRDDIKIGQYLNASSQNNGAGPTADQVRNEFQNAKPGDVVQMYWSYNYGGGTCHTALINGFDSNGVYFFQSHVGSSTTEKVIKNSYY